MNPHCQSIALNGLLLGWSPASRPQASLEPIWDTDGEGHLITVAPTGSGKGVGCIIPALLTWRGPVIVIDPRGENYAVTAARRRAMGHQVHVLDPFGVTDESNPASLNPLDLLDPNDDQFEDDCAVVAKLLVQDRRGSTDPFWDERATAFIVAIIKTLYHLEPTSPMTLRDVREVLTDHRRLLMPSADDHQSRFTRALAFSDALSQTEFASERTRYSITATAASHLGFLRSDAVYRSLSSSTITLDDIRAGALQSIYLVIPPDKLITLGPLLRLWVGVMMATIARRRRRPPQPTLFIVDEAAQLGAMDALRTGITLMRGYGMRVWTFWQDLSQLKRIYSEDWESILNNSTTQQFFGAATPSARRALNEYLAGYLPEADLAPDNAVIYRKGKVRVVFRPDYRRDAIMKGLASPNPLYEAVDLPPLAQLV